MRLVLLLHARQAARHCDCCFVVRHLQKAWHGSLRPAQAVPTPSGLSTAPAKTAPSRRSDSRRGIDLASDLENSSKRWSMIVPSLFRDGCLGQSSVCYSQQFSQKPPQVPKEQEVSSGHTKPHVPQLLLSQFKS